MRHIFESIAMVMLISSKNIDTFERYHQNPMGFSVHTSLGLVLRYANRGKFRTINKEAWKAFMEMEKFYVKYSHASALALSHVISFDTKGSVVIGGHFDAEWIDHYGDEVKRYINGVDVLKNIIEGI
jgi:hypothetical protein